MSIRKVSYQFTRPADTTPYQDTDLIANSTTAGSVVPMSFNIGPGGGRIVQVRVSKSDETDVANSAVSLHFYEDLPVPANGDNGAFSGPLKGYLGPIAVATMVATFVTDEAYQHVKLGATALVGGLFTGVQKLYALMEADAAYAPASEEVFTVTLWIEKT